MLYVSSLLQTDFQYKNSADNLFDVLDTRSIRYTLLDGTRDIWLRDFMPIRRKDSKYISFRYEPSYLNSYPQLKTNFKRDISGQFRPMLENVLYSNINLDGGNVVFSPSREKAVVSDRVFSENPDLERNELLRKLEELLEAQVIIIPSLPSDLTGHADGMVRFVDEGTVIGNRTPYQNGLEQRIKKTLTQEGLSVVDFPYYSSPGKSAVGCYLNFMEMVNHIFLPVFGSDMDQEAVKLAKQLFSKEIVPVCLNEIAAKGGCLNCISWEIGKEETIEYSMDDSK